MRRLPALVRSRWLLLLVAAVVVGAIVLATWRPWAEPDGAEVVSDPATHDGWKTIEFHGIRVDIPQDWDRLVRDECEFQFERWGPPDADGCTTDAGVGFYYSATFDPAHGPGVRRTDETGLAALAWGGWTEGGEYDVYAADADRDVVAGVLESVQPGPADGGG